jgi:xanthine/uracil permease
VNPGGTSKSSTGEIVGTRIGRDDVARALRADGLATTIGGIMNSFPYTCFADSARQEHVAWLVEAATVASRRFGDQVADVSPIHSARARSLRRGEP